MTYADWSFYKGEFYGVQIPEDDFERLASRASIYIDYYTRGKAKSAVCCDRVAMCCCALAEAYHVMDAAQATAAASVSKADVSDGEIQSETVGSYSVTRRSGGDTAASALKAAGNARETFSQICREYLADTGLLYRGGKCIHHIV